MFLGFSLKIKNRVGVMRYVVLHGRLWDDLYIGFQNRISRDPDIYHHKYTHLISYIKTIRVQYRKQKMSFTKKRLSIFMCMGLMQGYNEM